MDGPTFDRLRLEYPDEPLTRAELPADPVTLFRAWLRAATDSGVSEPNGMALATVDATHQPHCRVVLLKNWDARGLVFFTNRNSDKGTQLTDQPRAAATFWWQQPRNRQVRITGTIGLATEAESDTYFAARPRLSQLASAASPQSRPLRDRQELQALMDALAARVGDGPVPRPAHWGGYVLRPRRIEFWQGRLGRLHDRFRYDRDDHDTGWRITRLAP